MTSFRPLPASLSAPVPPRSAVRSVCRCDRGSDPPVPPSRLLSAPLAAPLRPPAVRSVSRCDRGSDPPVPELATEGLTQCRAPLHETPAPHSSDPKPLSVAAPPPFRRCASSFPSQCVLLSVATGGQTRCCQPSFARWHIGSDPFPPPFPPPCRPLSRLLSASLVPPRSATSRTVKANGFNLSECRKMAI